MKIPAQQIAADLLSAANMIDHFGWIQGTGSGPNGEVCAYIAITRVAGGYVPFSDALAAMKRTVGIPNHEPLSDWNDAPGRTQVEVVAKFREAAEAVFPNG